MYGLGRFPVTLYREQWEKLLGMADELRQFIKDHDAGSEEESKRRGCRVPRACRAGLVSATARRRETLTAGAPPPELARHIAMTIEASDRARPEHGHGLLDGRPRPVAHRRQGRGDRADATPRDDRLVARHPAPRAVREQDGPRRLLETAIRGDPRRVHRLLGAPAGLRPHMHPDLGPGGRQRRGALDRDALVRRALASRASRDRPHRARTAT